MPEQGRDPGREPGLFDEPAEPAAAGIEAAGEAAVLDPARLEADGSGEAETAEAGPPPWRALWIAALAWAIPGAGHLAVGRAHRAVLFAVLILGLFAGGLTLDGKVYRPIEGEPLTYLAALGAAGMGLPFVVVVLVGGAAGALDAPWFEYGSTFTLLAGLLNLLVVLDAYDHAVGRRP